MTKSRDAFRTISEVSTALDTPTHVLRFWESKFVQIKPVKRAGGRRYYRPEDISLLAGIKVLLHDQGLTIKGAQKLLREAGVKHVVTLGENNMTSPPVSSPPETTAPPPVTSEQHLPPETLRGLIAAADKDKLRANADKIAPLLARLEKLCDSLRAA